MFWIARTGTAWRDLHSHFGAWNSVYRQFQRWTQAGITTSDIGPSGPIKKFYAVGLETPDSALTEIEKRLKSGEIAQWVDAAV